MTPPPLGRGNNNHMGGGGVFVDSRGTLDINRKLAMRISNTRKSQCTLRRRNDHDNVMNYFK